MTKNNWSRWLTLNIHSPGTGIALILLSLTQIPVAIKTSAEIACIGQVSNKIWRQTKSHKDANIIAIQKCNGSSN